MDPSPCPASVRGLLPFFLLAITRAVSALVFAGTVLASSAAWAGLPSRVGTPFDVASRAYRGQLEGIPGYTSLQSGLRSGKISGEAILKAAGVEVNSRDANLVESFLRDSDNNNESTHPLDRAAGQLFWRQASCPERSLLPGVTPPWRTGDSQNYPLPIAKCLP